MVDVAVVIPGIMGSELKKGNDTIWPGSIFSMLLPYGKMDELKDENLSPTDLVRSYAGTSQYSSLLELLTEYGFKEDSDPPTLYTFPYDWRKDNALAAEFLADKLDAILAAHRGDASINLIAHSMGGLVSRCYLESGAYGARPAHAKVARLITLGTPHRGAPLALTAVLGQEKQLFLSKSQVRELVSLTAFPCLYQLLPPPGEPFMWDAAARYSPMDVYDAQVGAQLGLVADNVESARNFHSKLDLAKKPGHVRYFFFVGTRQTTTSLVLVERTAGAWKARARELDEAGDGTVPAWSGTVTAFQGLPVGGSHSSIFKNRTLRTTLATLLGAPDVLAADEPRLEVALREDVVTTRAKARLTLEFFETVKALDGRLEVQLAQMSEAGDITGYDAAVSSQPLAYSGGDATALGLVIAAPADPGVYRIGYIDKDNVEPEASAHLVVQA